MSETLPISLETVVAQVRGQLSCTLASETVLMSIETGQYYYLNKVGSRIWDLLATPHCVADLCITLLATYEVERSQCEHEGLAFLDNMYTDKLIQVAS
jgi:hypothetical protein